MSTAKNEKFKKSDFFLGSFSFVTYNEDMKWLIISEENASDSDLNTTLQKNFPDAEIFSESLGTELKLNFDFLCGITHSVILCPLNKNLSISYILGFFLGQGTKIFTTDTDIRSDLLDSGLVQVFKDEKSLVQFVKESSSEILQEQLEEESYNYLFENGYPFDGENFAHHIEKWNKEICVRYVDAGMDVNTTDSDGTPMLNIAARTDNMEAVKWLVSCGARLDSVSKDRGYTAIMDSVWRGNAEMTRFFIEQGAELDTISKEGQTMLILAVGADKTEIVKMLAENGANPDIKDGMGMSAYGYAKLFKKTEILSILEKYHKEQ